jgi:pimeloyl-ACP methyl ester carboxylesterase
MIFEDVAGVRTEVFHIHSLKQSAPNKVRKALHFLIAPGNPGALYFYTPWLQALQSSIETITDSDELAISCHGCSHANHHFRDEFDNEGTAIDYSFDDQIRHFEMFCESVVARDLELYGNGFADSIQLILCGHSIGAYMVVDILSRNDALRRMTISMHLLMPFIGWTNLTLSQRTKLNIYRSTPEILVRFLAGKVYEAQAGVDPERKAMFIRKSHPEMDIDAVNVTANTMLTRRLVQNFISMANTELDAVIKNEDRMIQDINRLSGQMRVYALYTDNDVWAPLKDMTRLRRECPFVVTQHIPNLTHAFSTSLDMSVTVAEAMLSEIRLNRGLPLAKSNEEKRDLFDYSHNKILSKL